MDFKVYQEYLQRYIDEAILNSDGSNRGISEYLWAQQVKGRFARHRQERLRALTDARRAFDEHRHWPLEIVLSHLGLKKESPRP
jgi:hypothetical protein